MYGWPPAYFVWIQHLCFCWFCISFTSLVESKRVIQKVTRTVILPPMVSVLWLDYFRHSSSSRWCRYFFNRVSEVWLSGSSSQNLTWGRSFSTSLVRAFQSAKRGATFSHSALPERNEKLDFSIKFLGKDEYATIVYYIPRVVLTIKIRILWG